jgi:hypothetical protein
MTGQRDNNYLQMLRHKLLPKGPLNSIQLRAPDNTLHDLQEDQRTALRDLMHAPTRRSFNNVMWRQFEPNISSTALEYINPLGPRLQRVLYQGRYPVVGNEDFTKSTASSIHDPTRYLHRHTSLASSAGTHMYPRAESVVQSLAAYVKLLPAGPVESVMLVDHAGKPHRLYESQKRLLQAVYDGRGDRTAIEDMWVHFRPNRSGTVLLVRKRSMKIGSLQLVQRPVSRLTRSASIQFNRPPAPGTDSEEDKSEESEESDETAKSAWAKVKPRAATRGASGLMRSDPRFVLALLPEGPVTSLRLNSPGTGLIPLPGELERVLECVYDPWTKGKTALLALSRLFQPNADDTALELIRPLPGKGSHVILINGQIMPGSSAWKMSASMGPPPASMQLGEDRLMPAEEQKQMPGSMQEGVLEYMQEQRQGRIQMGQPGYQHSTPVPAAPYWAHIPKSRVPMAVQWLYDLYKSGYGPPGWALEASDTILRDYASTAVVICDAGDSPNDVVALLAGREPTHIGSSCIYNAENACAGVEGAYGPLARRALEYGQLPPNIATMAYVPIYNKDTGTSTTVWITNLIGLALDHEMQPDFIWWETQGKSTMALVRFYTKVMRKAFASARHVEAKRLVLTAMGTGDSVDLVGMRQQNFIHNVLLPAIHNASKEIQAEPIEFSVGGRALQLRVPWGVLSLTSAGDEYLGEQFGNIGSFPECFSTESSELLAETVVCNAWDPWSIAGNGNEHDANASLDGNIGRASAVAILTHPATNPYLLCRHRFVVVA